MSVAQNPDSVWFGLEIGNMQRYTRDVSVEHALRVLENAARKIPEPGRKPSRVYFQNRIWQLRAAFAEKLPAILAPTRF